MDRRKFQSGKFRIHLCEQSENRPPNFYIGDSEFTYSEKCHKDVVREFMLKEWQKLPNAIYGEQV